VSLTHSGVPPRPSGEDYWVPDLLMLSLANLASHCEGKCIGPRCDFAAPPEGEARASVDIAASPAEVFASLIEPAQLDRWIADHAEVEPRLGGRYDFGWDHGIVAARRAGSGRRRAPPGPGPPRR
jgi:Activator of Hsp90 ATPase homolog 1-like protein